MQMTRAILLAVGLSCFVVGGANADAMWVNGNDHWEWCQHTSEKNFKPVSAGFCTGYILGVLDALNGAIMCVPQAVTKGQLTDVVKLWLRDNPGQRQYVASDLVITALKEKFPCN
jgi:hypothetical protein